MFRHTQMSVLVVVSPDILKHIFWFRHEITKAPWIPMKSSWSPHCPRPPQRSRVHTQRDAHCGAPGLEKSLGARGSHDARDGDETLGISRDHWGWGYSTVFLGLKNGKFKDHPIFRPTMSFSIVFSILKFAKQINSHTQPHTHTDIHIYIGRRYVFHCVQDVRFARVSTCGCQKDIYYADCLLKRGFFGCSSQWCQCQTWLDD